MVWRTIVLSFSFRKVRALLLFITCFGGDWWSPILSLTIGSYLTISIANMTDSQSQWSLYFRFFCGGCSAICWYSQMADTPYLWITHFSTANSIFIWFLGTLPPKYYSFTQHPHPHCLSPWCCLSYAHQTNSRNPYLNWFWLMTPWWACFWFARDSDGRCYRGWARLVRGMDYCYGGWARGFRYCVSYVITAFIYMLCLIGTGIMKFICFLYLYGKDFWN